MCCIRRTLFREGRRAGKDPGVTESAENDLDMLGALEPFAVRLPVLGVLIKGEDVGDTTSSSANEGRVAISRILESDLLRVMPCELCELCEGTGDTKEDDELD